MISAGQGARASLCPDAARQCRRGDRIAARCPLWHGADIKVRPLSGRYQGISRRDANRPKFVRDGRDVGARQSSGGTNEGVNVRADLTKPFSNTSFARKVGARYAKFLEARPYNFIARLIDRAYVATLKVFSPNSARYSMAKRPNSPKSMRGGRWSSLCRGLRGDGRTSLF